MRQRVGSARLLMGFGPFRALFQDFTGAERQNGIILQCPDQLKPDLAGALLATREYVITAQGSFMHEAVRVVIDAIDAAPAHTFTWPKLLHPLSPQLSPKHPIRSPKTIPGVSRTTRIGQ